MKNLRLILTAAAAGAILFGFATVFAQDGGTTYGGSLFIGSHYTGTDEFIKRVGEFNRGEDEAMGELGFRVFGSREFNRFQLEGQFYDPDQFFLVGNAQIEDQFKFELDVRSFHRQRATDLLANMSVREAKASDGTGQGGKMVTHENLNPGADYGYDRRSLSAYAEYNPRGAEWLKLAVAHRTILEKGDDQRVSSGHCSSCHLTSQTGERDNRTHAFTGAVEADAGKAVFGYEFDYRIFKPEGEISEVLYDSASHPVNGRVGDEFASRLNFEDTVVSYGTLPEFEKMAHAVQARAKIGQGNLLARASLAQTKNNNAGIEATATGGIVQYAVRTSKKTSLRIRGNVRRVENDEFFVDVPTWRDGRGGGGQDFDFTRFSALTRTEGEGEVELLWRPARRTRVSFLGGYESIQRDDYPTAGGDESTNRIIGQAKVTHRANAQTTLRFKYRLESTDQPFTHYNGIYETAGKDVLERNSTTGLAYYFQREALKVVDITNQPTIEHLLQGSVNLRPSAKLTANIGAKLTLEKNSDLDSLDYERTLFQPTGTITFTPDNQWSFFGSYTFQMDESNGPVVVPIMDG